MLRSRASSTVSTSSTLGRASGFGLVELLLASGLGVIISLAILRSLSDSQVITKKAESQLSRAAIKGMLVDRVDCGTTLAPTPPACVAGSYAALRDSNNRVLLPAGGGKIGDFVLRARCSLQGLEVRGAVLSSAGNAASASVAFVGPNRPEWYRKDSGGLALDWKHPQSLIFGSGRTALCSQRFGTADADAIKDRGCPDNTFMSGINFYQNTVTCLPKPKTCGSQEVLAWTGADFECRPVARAEDIRNKMTIPAIEVNTRTLESGAWTCFQASRFAAEGITVAIQHAQNVTLDALNKDWGLRCREPFRRMGCHMAGGSSARKNKFKEGYPDWDVKLRGNSCFTDDEERQSESTLSITCCKQPDPVQP